MNLWDCYKKCQKLLCFCLFVLFLFFFNLYFSAYFFGANLILTVSSIFLQLWFLTKLNATGPVIGLAKYISLGKIFVITFLGIDLNAKKDKTVESEDSGYFFVIYLFFFLQVQLPFVNDIKFDRLQYLKANMSRLLCRLKPLVLLINFRNFLSINFCSFHSMCFLLKVKKK